ncbi:hypothetical protein RIF29_12777 [Crotalaria pallida]|uniref:Uncharacterized protein n=1 Tax=Crotalaria pallida TaxID=3830 RepID=A0AAN9INS8_CROPI
MVMVLLQTLCCGLSSQPLQSSDRRIISPQPIGPHAQFKFQSQRFHFGNASKCLKWVVIREPSALRLNKFQRLVIHASDSNVNGGLVVRSDQSSSSVPVTTSYDEAEPFPGKSGSVSFYGMTHQSLEEGKLESAPFKEEESSYFWLLAPGAFVGCLILPQFFVGNVIEAFLKDVILVDIVTSFIFDTFFYIGFAIFLYVVDRVQRPFLQYSAKRWSLITGLRGYLFSALFTMGFKITAPLLLLCATWPVIRQASLVAMAPFIVGCAVQFAFETYFENRGSSCWPLVPIIFEVYRLYQLTKAAQFAEKLIFAVGGLPVTAELVERSGALFATLVTCQALGLACLWSLMTFLLRLFPSRPVVENY